MSDPTSTPESLALIVRRTIRATPQRLFAAWTEPQQLRSWWGPAQVRCSAAEVDLRVGGRYRIANEFADGRVLWIQGEFEVISPPDRLVYSWRVDESPRTERVTVRFEPRPEGTEVIVVHERIADEALKQTHQAGWEGCLDGLARFVD